ncbi:MAG: GWxTD domain-containing protein [Bacteroidota bacterium]
MKKLFTLLFISFSALQFSHAQLTAFMSYGTFDNPDGSPYLETYLKVLAGSSKLAELPSGKLQSKIEVKWIFKSGDKIVHFEKYNLLSPEIDKTDSVIPDFINQQRINLANGVYTVELTLKDLNTSNKEHNVSQEIKIDYTKEKVMISDIELLESFAPTSTANMYSKNGYDLIPYAGNFYPSEITKLRFYAEIYNTLSTNNDPFIVRYYISDSNNDKILDDLYLLKKQNAQKVNMVLAEFPIENLPDGNYDVNIEVISKENKLLAFTHMLFQRSNKIRQPVVTKDFDNIDITNTFVSNITNPDTLVYLIDVLYPISNSQELNIETNQMDLRDVRSMQRFLYYFWSKRNPQNPQLAWEEYMVQVMKVNNSYAALNSRGYQTDRGRVYLQYGPPSTEPVVVNNDPESYPYEIWHYYKIEHQTNKKFVFYSPDMVTRNYKLLHSDLSTEIHNDRWELVLRRKDQFLPDMDAKQFPSNFGNQTKENFKN